MNALKKLKVAKGCLKLSFLLWLTNWRNHFCALGRQWHQRNTKVISWAQIKLHCYIMIPCKCPCKKPYFTHSAPPPPRKKKNARNSQIAKLESGGFPTRVWKFAVLIDMSSIVYKMNLELGALTYDVRCFFGFFWPMCLPIYPNQVLYYISSCSI